jgi:membrane protease YdiL (CAAX protease family)
MLEFRDSDPPVTAKARAPKTWDFMETTFVALIAYAVFTLTVGYGAGIILLITQGGLDGLTATQFHEMAMQRRWLGVGLIVACPATIAVVWVAIRMAGRDFSEYLALNWPSRKELLIAFAVAFGWIVASIALSPYDSSASSSVVVGGAAGGLFVLLLGGCLAAPIMEEFVFRGFMFRGWSESFLGPVGAIVLTSILFGMCHTQYDWLGRFWIFLFGLAMCTIRWRSNSTWLTVVVHSAVNIFLFFLSGPYV